MFKILITEIAARNFYSLYYNVIKTAPVATSSAIVVGGITRHVNESSSLGPSADDGKCTSIHTLLMSVILGYVNYC